jgi:hypothetical protein
VKKLRKQRKKLNNFYRIMVTVITTTMTMIKKNKKTMRLKEKKAVRMKIKMMRTTLP